MKKTLLTVSALLAVATVSQGALISPIGAELGDATINGGTTFLETVGASHGRENWYNGDGLNTTTNGTTGLANHDPYSGGVGSRIRNAASGSGAHVGSIDFALAGATDLNGWVLWNGNEDDARGDFTRTEAQRDKTGRGIASADLLTSTDGINFTHQGVFNFAQEVYTHNTSGLSVGDSLGQFNAFTTVEDVTHVRLNVVNHGGGNIVNFDEVAFQAVPEPATLGLVAAFGGAIMFIRRRRMI